jgi:hypothetical protein
MKMSKKQRRLASKLLFPIVALVMMTATMAFAGADQRTSTAATR